MRQQSIMWNYCGMERNKEFILSLDLLGNINWPAEKQLACLYSAANHTERHYKSMMIKKQNGKSRRLSVPDGFLKKIQRNILKNVLTEQPVSPYATAYRKHANISTNAGPHVGSKAVLKLDIEDFFRTISFSMVYRYGFPPSRFPPAVRGLLTSLCCFQDCLPQGAPTSPYLSNLVMKSFDEYIGNWCGQRNIAYTRYSDDMTFSGDFDRREIQEKSEGFLENMGFRLNRAKTGYFKKGVRQTVTGLVVNDRIGVPADYRKKLRQEIYYLGRFGVASHVERMGNRRFPPGDTSIERYLVSLLGKVNFVLQMEPENEFFRQAAMEIKNTLFHWSKQNNS